MEVIETVFIIFSLSGYSLLFEIASMARDNPFVL